VNKKPIHQMTYTSEQIQNFNNKSSASMADEIRLRWTEDHASYFRQGEPACQPYFRVEAKASSDSIRVEIAEFEAQRGEAADTSKLGCARGVNGHMISTSFEVLMKVIRNSIVQRQHGERMTVRPDNRAKNQRTY
jgi:hypothetical protein